MCRGSLEGASAVLPGLGWVQLGLRLRLRNIATGALLPTAAEAEATRADTATAQAEAEAARADTAEAAIALLHAEIARLCGA